MMRFWKKNEKVATILKCLLIIYVVTAIMLLVLAFLLYKFSLPQKVIGAGIILIYVVCSFLGGFLAGKKIKIKKYLWGLCVGIGYFLLLIILSLILNGGFQNLSDNFFLTLILCGSGGMLGGMLG